MPHAHHADLVMRHVPVRREVVPPHRLPLLVPTTAQGTELPSLVARAPASSNTSSSGEKPTSSLTTTVLPVVLGAGYVLENSPRGQPGSMQLTVDQRSHHMCHRRPDFPSPETCEETDAGRRR